MKSENEYMKKVSVRVYAELNDFLRKDLRQTTVCYSFRGRVTVKEAVESLGVPHSAVDLVLLNSNPAGWNHLLNDGDYLSVYPEFETFDVTGLTLNGRKPLRNTKFIVDAHLGGLARKLRLLGFDSVYEPGIHDDTIIELASSEKRIILTRDKGILRSGKVDHAYFVRNTHTQEQIREVVDKFALKSQFRPFTRCLICNEELNRIESSVAKDLVDQDTLRIFSDFFRCSGCGKVYWEGSHYDRMRNFICDLEK